VNHLIGTNAGRNMYVMAAIGLLMFFSAGCDSQDQKVHNGKGEEYLSGKGRLEERRKLLASIRDECRDTFVVTTTEDRNDVCREGDCSLREAVMAANACPGRNTIEIPRGKFLLTLRGPEADGGISGADDAYYDLDIFEEVTIIGAGVDETVINGAGIDGFGIIDVLHLSGGSKVTTITGVTLEGGVGTGGGLAVGTILGTVDTRVVMANSAVKSCLSHTFGGGVIVYRNAELQLLDVELSRNSALQSGGGLYNWSGTVSIVNSRFITNKSVNGGGLASQHPLDTDLGGRPHLVITQSLFEDNISVRNDDSGYAPGGGGLVAVDEVVHIRDTKFIKNRSDGNGGGMGFGRPSLVKLTNVEVSENEGYWGGGILNSGFLSARGLVVRNNVARGTSGGGIYSSGSVDIVDATIEGNESHDQEGDDQFIFQSSGGGISLHASGSIRKSTFHNNRATLGGGLYNTGTSALLNSTVSGNEAKDGGGIYNDGIDFRVKNCTIVGNTADRGRGIFTHSSYPLLVGPDFPSMTVNHTIVADQGGMDLGPSLCFDEHFERTSGGETGLFSRGFNLRGNDSCAFTESTDILNADPMLGGLADNGGQTRTHLPLAGSPVINAGSATTTDLLDTSEALKVDQRDIQRPKTGGQPGGLRCDIGAVELKANNERDLPTLLDTNLPLHP
jgi:CSLREA domain-containing protein